MVCTYGKGEVTYSPRQDVIRAYSAVAHDSLSLLLTKCINTCIDRTLRFSCIRSMSTPIEYQHVTQVQNIVYELRERIILLP